MVMVTSSDEVHEVCVVVQRKIYVVPVNSPVTSVAFAVGAKIISVVTAGLTCVHNPVPTIKGSGRAARFTVVWLHRD